MARPGFRRRSVKEWSIRLLLAGAAGWIGYLSVTQSLAVALPDSQLERAYSLAPNNGRVAGRLSERIWAQKATPADRAKAVRLANAALRHDPTAVEAVVTLGFDAWLRGDLTSARRLFTYSQVLTRRDLRTQLWAIEDAVARGDVGGALKHYDIALRTEKTAPGLLYPVLSGAIIDPAVRTKLVETLARKPLWADSFVDYAASNSFDHQATAALFRELRRAQFPISERANSTLIKAMVAKQQLDDAWSFYSTVREGVARHQSRDPRFTAMLESPSLFDWVPVNGTGISTAIQPNTKGGVFDFAVSPSTGGLLLQQLQFLPAGEYELQGHSTGIDQSSDARPYWALSCHGGKELGRLNIPNSSRAGGNFSGRFIVPAACPTQVLAFVARSSSEITGVAGQIDRVLLHPSR